MMIFEEYKSDLFKSLAGVDLSSLAKLVRETKKTIKGKKKLFFAGNGGSASTASHLAADLGKNTTLTPKPKTISLCDNLASITALGNDLSYEDVFSEQIKSLGEKGDVLFVISASGNSKNIIKLIKTAKKMHIYIIGLLGFNGGKASELVDIAKGEILMIYDADRTVAAADLEKFYDALQQGKAQFANGSRLIYPMEKDAMRTFNKVGNKVFSLLFTWILGQRFKDTLCGTKAFFRKDYLKFTKLRQDPFGDFELIFGAIDRNLKVVEIPVVYKERVYGSTNISRFKNGLQLLQMVIQAFRRFRYY